MGLQYRQGVFDGNLEGSLEGTLTLLMTSCQALSVCCVGGPLGTPAGGSKVQRGPTCESWKGNRGAGAAWGLCKEQCPVRGFAEAPQVSVGPRAPLRGGGGSDSHLSVCSVSAGTGQAQAGLFGHFLVLGTHGDPRSGPDVTSRSTRTGPGALPAVTGVPATRRWGVPAPVTWPAGLRLCPARGCPAPVPLSPVSL